MTAVEINALGINEILNLAESYGRLTEHARSKDDRKRVRELDRQVGWCLEALKRKSKGNAVNRNLQSWWAQLEYGENAYKKERGRKR